MRPIALKVRGFACYRDEDACDLDLSNLDLFVITGPTGSGKSTLIDAITYALYGQVPRVGRDVKDCIAQNMDRMEVAFEFDVGPQRYRVFRSTALKGQATVQLEECRDGRWEALAGRVAEVNQRIEHALGLDYHAFTRSVLLPQGEFAQFLAGAPDDRRKVLSKLLRTDVFARMGTRAAQTARAGKVQADELKRRIEEDYADATDDNLRAHRRRRRELSAAAAALKVQRDALVEAWQEAERLSRARAELQQVQEQVRQAAEARERAEQLLAEGERQLQDLGAELDKLAQRIAKNPYDDQVFARLSGALPLAKDLATLESRSAAASRELDAQRGQVKATEAEDAERQQAAREAAAALAEAEQVLEQARRDYAASLLQEGLQPGDPCPVCGQPVGQLPHLEHTSYQEATAEVRRLKTQQEATRKAADQAGTALALASQKLDQLQSALQQLQADRSQKAEALRVIGFEPEVLSGGGALPSGEWAEMIEAALRQQETARRDLEALRSEREQREGKRRQKEADLEQARGEQGKLAERGTLAHEAEERAALQVEERAGRLSQWASAGQWEDVLRALQDGGDPSDILKARSAQGQTDLDAANGQLTLLANAIERLEKRIAARARLVAEEKETREAEAVARELADLLRADRFPAFVQEQALRVLAEDGSRHLDELSGGRYAFQVEGQEFLVVDHWNADETRPVKTLSGGETFLASLALAQALAERLPELGGGGSQAMLESLFLDEGFGMLDEEALDTVATAIESLRNHKRMVCIITHLPQLAARMPACVEVIKSEAGSRVQVRG